MSYSVLISSKKYKKRISILTKSEINCIKLPLLILLSKSAFAIGLKECEWNLFRGIVILFWDDLLANGLNASLLWGIGLSALGTYGFSLGNMFSIRHQRRGLETLTTNSWAMLYGTLVMGAIALLRGDNFMPEWTVSYLGALLYLALFGSVIAFGAYFTLVGRIGASKAAYSTLLFPLVALSISTVYEGYVWHSNAVIGLALILLGNMVMFAKPEQLLLRRRLA